MDAVTASGTNVSHLAADASAHTIESCEGNIPEMRGEAVD